MAAVAENLLLNQLARCLRSSMHNMRAKPAQAAQLPGALELSEAFPEHYGGLLRHAVPQRLSERFGLRDFYVVENDRTRRVKVSQPAFWHALRFRFSRAGVDALWDQFRGATLRARSLTDWDTLLVSWVLPRAASRFEGPRPEDWTVGAYWLLEQFEAGGGPLESLPLRSWYDDPGAVPIPMRFLLLEHAAATWAAARSELEERVEEARRADALEWSRDGWPACDPRHPHFLGWVASAPQAFGFAAVQAAAEHWRGPGQLGLDDADYLDSYAQSHQLFEHGRSLQAALENLGRPTGDPQ